jgi:hypothetical protein
VRHTNGANSLWTAVFVRHPALSLNICCAFKQVHSYDLTLCWYCLLTCAEHLDSVAEQHAAALAPVIAGLQGEVSGLRSDLEQQRLAAAVAQQELEGQRSRLAEVSMRSCSRLICRCISYALPTTQLPSCMRQHL